MNTSQIQWPLNRQSVVQLLQSYMVQPTQQRVEIAQIMFQRPCHMSADQVLSAVNDIKPSVSKATVYNTLGLFAEKGLLRQVIVDPNRVFYDSNNSEHHHFYNMDTGMLTDVSASQVNIDASPELPEGVALDGIDVIIRVRNA